MNFSKSWQFKCLFDVFFLSISTFGYFHLSKIYLLNSTNLIYHYTCQNCTCYMCGQMFNPQFLLLIKKLSRKQLQRRICGELPCRRQIIQIQNVKQKKENTDRNKNTHTKKQKKEKYTQKGKKTTHTCKNKGKKNTHKRETKEKNTQ